MTQSSETLLTNCSTGTSVAGPPWAPDGVVREKGPLKRRLEKCSSTGERGPQVPAAESYGERHAGSPASSAAAATLPKPRRKLAQGAPDGAEGHGDRPGSGEGLISPGSPCLHTSSFTASTTLLSPSSGRLEHLNTNRNNSTSLDQPPPYPAPYHHHHCTLPTTPSPTASPSLHFKDTPVLRCTPGASTVTSSITSENQTLPTEEVGRRSQARRRYSLGEEGGGGVDKTHSVFLGGGAPKLGRIICNKRSQSMSGMLIPKDGDAECEKERCDSDWIIESTV